MSVRYESNALLEIYLFPARSLNFDCHSNVRSHYPMVENEMTYTLKIGRVRKAKAVLNAIHPFG